MARKAGGKLRPVKREKQPRKPIDSNVLKVLRALLRKGLVATQGSFKRLSRWLSYMAAGSTVDYRTPFFGTKGPDGKLKYRPREEIVPNIARLLQTVELGPYPSDFGEYLREMDSAELEHIGPMSMFLPWNQDGPEKAKAVFSDKPRKSEFDTEAWSRALDRLISLVPVQSCVMSSLEEAISGLSDDQNSGMDTTTNSGTPFWMRGWKPSSDTLKEKVKAGAEDGDNSAAAYRWYYEESKRLISTLNRRVPIDQIPYQWATASQRLVQKGPEPFTPKSKRLVEAYPKQEAIVWKCMTLGIMNALRSYYTEGGNCLMAAWFDLPTIDANMQHILHVAGERGWTVNSGDVSNFDASIPPWALWDVAQAISKWVRGGEQLARNMAYAMIYKTVLITPSGFYGPGPSSMKSGSGVTNLLGSMSNLAILFYGQELGLYKLTCYSVLGDDFITLGEGVNPDSTAAAFAEFGMEAHPDKQFYRPNALQFLKRLHYVGYPGGIASVSRTLGSCLSLERLSVKPSEWNSYAYVVQALSKLNNAVFHPGFELMVDFLRSGDKLQLGAGMTPQEIVTGSGIAGQSVLKEGAQQSWKRLGNNTSFENWAVNGVLRGERLPPLGLERFKRVYGMEPSIHQ